MRKEIAEGLYFKAGFVVLTWGGYEYDIARERIDTPEKLLHWVCHLAQKSWMDLPKMRYFIRAIMKKKGWKRDEGKMSLKTARQLNNMHQWQLAAAIGVTQELISMYETGKQKVPIKRRSEIEKVIGGPIQFDTQKHQRPVSKAIAEWEKEII